ncbi:PVC-type heme-binding CxxCH protein, partial [Singulisphaera rosea]
EVDAKVFDFLREQSEPEQSVAARGLAADVLSRATLKPEQLVALVDSIKTIGPLELDRILSSFERSTSDDLGFSLIDALKASRVRSTLRAEMLRPRFAKFGDAVRKESEAFYITLNVDAAKQKAKLESLVSSLQGGDIRRGQSVFNSAKAACVSCHSIGYIGGKVGPDLTRIGQIRTDRDLLEAIVYPSASFVRSYEPLVVATKEGKVVNGVSRKDAPDEIVLATGPTEEARIARDDIEEIRPGTVSVMPAGLDQQLSPEDLADLVAFLKACR